MIERVLNDRDINVLAEFVDRPSLYRLRYVNSNLGNDMLSLLALRNRFFNYTIFGYGLFEDQKLIAVVLMSLPEAFSNKKGAVIDFVRIDDTIDEAKFINSAVKSLYDDENDIKKVKLYYDTGKDDVRLYDILNTTEFVSEVKLDNSTSENNNLIVYSNFRSQ